MDGRMLEEQHSSVSFRRARASEAVAIRELIVRSMGHWEHAPAYLQEARELMSLSAEDLERDEAWLAMVDGEVVGFYRLSRAGENAEIEEFHLEPAWIGCGMGRAMFEHAVPQGRSIGAWWLTWTTEPNALGFYLQMGGEVTGTEPSGIEGEEPMTCMRLDLRAR